MRDAVVIGAGLAGLMSALVLAEAGYCPLIVAKGQGATHWTSGTVDILGYLPGHDTPLTAPLAALPQLLSMRPMHPYRLLGEAGLHNAVAYFSRIAAQAGYPLAGSLEHNLLVPTAVGALRPTTLLPHTMVAADHRLSGDLVVVGFRELRDFYPPLIATNLAAQGIAARPLWLDLPPIRRQLDFTTTTFAALFDDPEFTTAIGRALHTVAGGAQRIAFPAVLGWKEPLRVLHDLQRLTGAQVFEIPTLPPSVPGMRLWHLLQRAVVAAGGRLQLGSVVEAAEGRDGLLSSIASAAAARRQQHAARVFVLATGGILGGGLRNDRHGELREQALNLPVQLPAGPLLQSHLLDPHGHALFRGGIAVDQAFRPVDRAGEVVYRNVVVAGAALAGADPVREHSYEGLALATGYAAGQQAIRFLRTV